MIDCPKFQAADCPKFSTARKFGAPKMVPKSRSVLVNSEKRCPFFGRLPELPETCSRNHIPVLILRRLVPEYGYGFFAIFGSP